MKEEITYKEMMVGTFEPIFDRFCRIRNVTNEQKDKLRPICFQMFELGALSFTENDLLGAFAVCDSCSFPIFHGEARTVTFNDKNYHAKCDKT